MLQPSKIQENNPRVLSHSGLKVFYSAPAREQFRIHLPDKSRVQIIGSILYADHGTKSIVYGLFKSWTF